jgi:hypothetical protein
MCPPDILEMFCWYFMYRVTPQEWGITKIRTLLRWRPRGFLFQLCPCSVGVAQHKAHPKLKKQWQPFCKMT